MNKKHVPSLELCQEFDRLCKEKWIEVPETEYQWEKRMGEWSIVKSKELGVPYIDTADMKLYLPAPLVSELGEWLPRKYKTMYFDTIREAGKWRMTYTDQIKKEYLEVFEETTEANARQKMINYLLAEGIITTL